MSGSSPASLLPMGACSLWAPLHARRMHAMGKDELATLHALDFLLPLRNAPPFALHP